MSGVISQALFIFKFFFLLIFETRSLTNPETTGWLVNPRDLLSASSRARITSERLRVCFCM